MWRTSGARPFGKAPASSKRKIAIGDVRHTTGSVNLRRGAGVGKSRITVLRNNAKLVVVGKGQDARGRWWLKVDAGSRTGWVAKWLTD